MTTASATAPAVWERGRFDGARGSRGVLFGRMYEDPQIELRAFSPGGRIFCIASAGCSAMALAPRHEVVAVDVNAAQLAYAESRAAGGPTRAGAAERLVSIGHAVAPLVGWSRERVAEFLALDEPLAQIAYWRAGLATRRFGFALDALLSTWVLHAVYASPLVASLPARFGALLRDRMQRCFARHPNAANPYARMLLAGELADAAPPPEARTIRFVHDDAAAYLERAPAGGFDGFSLSNVLDGATPAYRSRLLAAVRRAAAPGAVVVLRSFAEPTASTESDLAADDRSMLWGSIVARDVARLATPSRS